MPDGTYLNILALAMLPVLGNISGGILAEIFRVSERTLSIALHGAAGVIFAVVGIELMPGALEITPVWVILTAFIAGGGFAIGIDHVTDRIEAHTGGTATAGAWAIYFGTAVDLFSDGVMIGTGSTINLELGLLLALGQTPADFPEGFATIATFRSRGVPRRKRLMLLVSFALPIFLGATIGFWAVRGQPAIVKYGLLAFTAGTLLTVVVEEIVPEAHQGDDAAAASMALVGGFALFALITVYF